MSRNLKPAHAGYRYQDIITAYFFVLSIIEKFESITVDQKQLEDDRFDDLQIIKKDGFKTKIQIKHSSVHNKELTLSEFTNRTSTNLTIDRLLLTNKLAIKPVDEFRLCATWIPPSSTDSLSNYLIETQEQPLFDAIKSKIYKLDYEKIWPQTSPPIWKPLKNRSDFTRSDFVEFCEKFLIELNLPHASTDLLSPSRVETELLRLLHEKIGIGQYPNSDRKVEDVAALAIALATWARANESKLDVNEIVKVLGIRTDFGRIAQAFPLDRKYFYDRPIFRENILNLNHGKKFHILMGPPGSGKSWELTYLSEFLKKELIVARHYCYLDPTDENSERRVTTDIFFANLLAELQDSIGEKFSSNIGLSANLSNFESALNELVSQNEKIVLIIDGLDHISRVKSSSSNLHDDETDIIEKLAALDIPDGVQLILGTQPGDHLTPIINRRENDVTIYHIPKWTVEDTIGLCRLYELDSIFDDHGITNQDEIFNLVAQKSDSIPLYARYLCKGLISNLKENPIEKPEDWLNKVPSIQGDIKIYYKYLYEQISNKARFVADLFSVIEFAITENELKEMFPPFQWRHVSTALKIFEPVFVQVEAQGGLRVFHESFRRFIRDELRSQNINLIDILDPLITWMTDKGFYKNAKSYRFLLSALDRANRTKEIYELISFNFVSTSINYGHTVDAIQNNIAITANIAAHSQDWAILTRCNELRRALYTYEDERLGGREYWLTYGRLFGHQALSERLLFDGRPTLDYFNGMQACLIIDDMGGIAPWKEYFNIKAIDLDENFYGDYFDPLTQLKSVEENNLAVIQCSLSLGLGFSILRKIYNYLIQFETDDQVPIYFIKCIAERLAKNDLIKTIEKLAKKFSIDDKTQLIGYSLYWGLADFYHKKGLHSLSKKYAECALALTKNSVLISKLIDYGINIASLVVNNKVISSIDVGLNRYPQKDNINLWVAELRILAHANQLEKFLNKELRRIKGVGWYRCWLKFTITILCAEVAEYCNIKDIFNILLEEKHPFVGEPRACDLYAIHGVIEYVISLGLKLVNTEDEWAHVLEVLQQVNFNTTTRLDREVNGPVSSDVIFQLLEPYSKNKDINMYILSALKEEINHIEKSGTYYSTHANLALKFTQILLNSENKEEALNKWQDIGIYLTSYGYRKDTTIFEIIDSVSVISHKSKVECLQSLEKLQPLISSVLMHTDGRSTRHAPNTWFNQLLNIAPEHALNVLARTIIQDNYHENWSTMAAYRSVATKLLNQANPLIVDSLWQTLPFEIEYENEGITLIKERLDCILKLKDIYPQLIENRINLLAAQVSNDAQRYNEDAIKELEKFSVNLGFPVKCQTHKQKKSIKPTNQNSWHSSSIPEPNYITVEIVPHPPEDYTLGDVIKCIRLIEKTKDKNYKNLNIYLSYKLQELVLEGKEDEAKKILFFYGHEVFSWADEHPLVGLAISLKNAECSDLAAICYTLAYMKSRGNGGWTSIGGSKQKDLLLSAKNLNEGLAKKVFSEELGRRLKYTDYGAGITQSLIERLRDWEYYAEAGECWEEAFKVIEHRLTLTRKYIYFAEYKYSESNSLDINEGIILLILLRLSEPRKTRKISALLSVTNILKLLPHLLYKPIESFALSSTPTSSLLLIMEILYYLEDNPFIITNGIKEVLELYVNSPIWGARVLSYSLLNRAGLDYNLYDNVYSSFTPSSENNFYDPYLLKVDPTNSLEKLSLLVPELPIQIENFLREEFKKAPNKELMQETIKLRYGRYRDVVPAVDVLTWHDELFISELNNCAQSLKKNLEQDHLWSMQTEEELVLCTLPDLPFHLGIYQSRVTRPLLPYPSELTIGLCPVNTVMNDPTYEGWVQLACIEHEYLNEEHGFSSPSEKVINISGITYIPEHSIEPSNFIPLVRANEEIWWVKDLECMINIYTNMWNPIVGISYISDIFGDSFLLIPPLEILLLEENLITADFSEKLCLRDCQGKELVRLRSWEVHGDQINSDAYKLRGMDLIVHPIVFEKFNKLYESNLYNYQFINRTELKKK